MLNGNKIYHLMKKRFKCVPSFCNSYYTRCPDFSQERGKGKRKELRKIKGDTV